MDIALPSLTIEGEIKGAATPSSQKLCVLIFSKSKTTQKNQTDQKNEHKLGLGIFSLI